MFLLPHFTHAFETLPLLFEDALGPDPRAELEATYIGYRHYSHDISLHHSLFTCLCCNHILVLVFTRSPSAQKPETPKFPRLSITSYPSSPHTDHITLHPSPWHFHPVSLLPRCHSPNHLKELFPMSLLHLSLYQHPLPWACVRA